MMDKKVHHRRLHASPRQLWANLKTPIDEIDASVAALRIAFATNKTKSLKWRKAQLTKLHSFMKESHALFADALKKDLNRNPAETASELLVLMNEIADALENLDEWAANKKCKTTLMTLTDKVEIRMEPLGVVCIIAPWNYPVLLLLNPFVAAIAAGCCVVLKPSEVAPATESLMAEWIPKILDSSAIRVVTGGVTETTRLLNTKFDLFFYTGSGSVGKIVMAAAAKQLTPVVLELGGKSPVYIHNDVDIDVAAKRLAWAKFLNCGQVCLSPDYVMVHTKIYRPFLESFRSAITSMYGTNPRESPDYGRIINSQHTQRLTDVLTRQLALGHCKLE
ncbi:aldehyde dehydrogenase 3, member A2, partial [Podochytrium sp. JEL0797]